MFLCCDVLVSGNARHSKKPVIWVKQVILNKNASFKEKMRHSELEQFAASFVSESVKDVVLNISFFLSSLNFEFQQKITKKTQSLICSDGKKS